MIAGKNVARIAARRMAAGREPADARRSVSGWKFVGGRSRRSRRGGVDWFSDNFLRTSDGGRRRTDETSGGTLPIDEDRAPFLVLLLDFNHLFAEPEKLI